MVYTNLELAYQWFRLKGSNYMVGIEQGTDPLVIGDCLSIVLPNIPVATPVQFFQDGKSFTLEGKEKTYFFYEDNLDENPLYYDRINK